MKKVAWNEATKKEASMALTLECTSSDESEYEESSDTEEPELVRYKIKPLPWQRSRLSSMKTELDNIYFKSLSRRTKAMLVPRKRGRVFSTRDMPDEIISWAMRQPNNSISPNESLSAVPVHTSTPKSSQPK